MNRKQKKALKDLAISVPKLLLALALSIPLTIGIIKYVIMPMYYYCEWMWKLIM